MLQSTLELSLSPQEFFRQRITAASQQLKIRLEEHVEFYLVNLLTEFIDPTRINLDFDSQTDVLGTPLVFLLQQALDAPEERQPVMYKRLGDASLYISGFFQDYFNRKTFDISYFITMGASAYNQAAMLYRAASRDDSRPETLDLLARNFLVAVDIMAQASDLPGITKPVDLLNVYDRWHRCGSERLRLILEENGITPIASQYKTAQ